LNPIKIHKHLDAYLLLIGIAGFLIETTGWAVDNPVLGGVADSGILKFNGEYYLIGTYTSGNMFVSSDLVHWRGPFHVFSMNNQWALNGAGSDSQINACSIQYLNGLFHLFWSVDFWSVHDNIVHIGHATSKDVLGPYEETRKEFWFANRIDPYLFRDEDGQLYFYMVKFTDGNVIWGQKMVTPWQLQSPPRQLLVASPETWEMKDHKVIEGPWVIKYRGKYFMLYNANHTSHLWGNYAIGCAVANGPLEFTNGSKYPGPVLKSNLENFDSYNKIFGSDGLWNYTTQKPEMNWTNVSYDDKNWLAGSAGFGSPEFPNSQIRKVNTLWEGQSIWLRRKFVLSTREKSNLYLWISHDGFTQVYINNLLIYQEEESVPVRMVKIPSDILQDENNSNVIAIFSERKNQFNYINASIIVVPLDSVEFPIMNLGQPNLIRGPNGFEWWLVYFGIFNGHKRSQAIDRVFFFDKTLYIDGPTDKDTPGFHPNPSKPTFMDLFDEKNEQKWVTRWKIIKGNWQLKDGNLVTSDIKESIAFPQVPHSTHYYFEVNLKVDSEFQKGQAGIYAYWKDEKNWFLILFEKEEKNLLFIFNYDGKDSTFSLKLPEKFDPRVFHQIKVFKNGGQFELYLDGLFLNKNKMFITSFEGSGLPGLYSTKTLVAFDGVIYTRGWDEFDSTITGWGSSTSGYPEQGEWLVSSKGLYQKKRTGKSRIFKGDMLEEYEFSVQLRKESGEDRNSGQIAGFYPIFIDSMNYLLTVIDFNSGKLIISGKKEGKDLPQFIKKITQKLTVYPDIAASDPWMKQLNFEKGTFIEKIEIKWQTNPKNFKLPLKIRIYQKSNGEFKFLKEEKNLNKGLLILTNKEIPNAIEALLLGITPPPNSMSNFDYARVSIQRKNSYNLRAIKKKNKIYIFLDGKEMVVLKNLWGTSQVGLYTQNSGAIFNGITLFDI